MKSANNLPDELIDMIEQDEGFSAVLYTDTEGFKTIGIGFALDKMPMPKEVADYWLRMILKYRFKQLTNDNEHGATFRDLNDARQYAVLNMSYQLGLKGLFEFRKMWKAISNKDWHKAGAEALDSRWAKQTPKRAKRISSVIITGDMSSYHRG